MVYSITYRRPSHQSADRDSLAGTEKQKSISDSISSGMAQGIPEALSFDRIIAGGVCPPCTTRDFMNYLKYIELSAENLQFYLWYRGYAKRFNELRESERALSPEWTLVDQEQAEGIAASASRNPKMSAVTAAVFNGTDFGSGARVVESEKNPFYTPPRTPSSDLTRDHQSMDSFNNGTAFESMNSRATNHMANAEGAFQNAGMKWQPLTVQPYREEIARIISIYIADGGARELNLSSKERTALLHALQNTTHPSAFREVITTVEWSLRCQAHPNFIRWTICNGNRARVVFARGLGTGGIVAGVMTGVLIALSNAGRGWRVLSFLGFMIGISTLIAAWKGMCVVLHGMHHRHLRPWELFTEDDESSHDMQMKKSSFDSEGSSNSYEDEPWIAKYDKRNLVRKVFDREVWIQEPALRQIQDTIFLQAILGAFVFSAIFTGIFCAVPKGNFY